MRSGGDSTKENFESLNTDREANFFSRLNCPFLFAEGSEGIPLGHGFATFGTSLWGILFGLEPRVRRLYYAALGEDP